MARIKKGDIVTVLSGKEKGKTGKVLRVFPDRQLALVEHLNVLKHFERPSPQSQTGGIVPREGPLPLSRLTLACPRCRKPVRMAWQVTQTSDKYRVCARCEERL